MTSDCTTIQVLPAMFGKKTIYPTKKIRIDITKFFSQVLHITFTQEADMSIETQIATATDTTPIHSADLLTGENGLARIVLNDQIYTLRITRAGKLILTK